MRALALALTLLLWGGGAAFAQAAADIGPDDATAGQVRSPVDSVAAMLPEPPAEPGADAATPGSGDDWPGFAARVHQRLSDGGASDFVLTQLRAELVTWRDLFESQGGTNGDRIETVKAQIVALGPVPADGATEDPAVTARRDDLEITLAALRAPALLAGERRTEANGLIAEIDAILRGQFASQLGTRDAAPLNPVHWSPALSALTNSVSLTAETITQSAGNAAKRQAALRSLPLSLALLVAVGLILWRAGPAITALGTRLSLRSPQHERLWRFLFSTLRLVLTAAGLVIAVVALALVIPLGARMDQLLHTLLVAPLLVLFSRFLAIHYFTADMPGPLPVTSGQAVRGARLTRGLGWIMALRVLIMGLMQADEAGADMIGVIVFPLDFLTFWLLWQMGSLLRAARAHSAADSDAERPATRHILNLFGWVGRGAHLAAGLGIVLAGLGYFQAGAGILYAGLHTLALLAVVVLLQRLIQDLYRALTGAEDGSALIPVLLGFGLAMLSIPVLALLWGARVTDLTEAWTAFRSGFQIGGARISPGVFLTFILIFAIGYTLTRLLQGTLKNTVLPKTRLDKGGQNAIASGLGYIGVFLSALIAITMAGIDLSSLAIVVGALSVGIGFGLQNVVSNFVSGIILLIERPISEGDWIEVGGQMGTVQSISVRSTRIQTFDRTDVIVPNADLVSGVVTNWTRGDSVGRIIVPVGVAYGSDTRRVEQILHEIAQAHPMVLLNPGPSVLFRDFGASSLDFEIRAILRDINAGMGVASELRHEIARRFAQEGIEIPFPQQDLWLRNPETLPGGGQTGPR